MRSPWLPLVLIGIALGAGLVQADDWPQWRGPQRNGVSKETGLLKEWPEGGPKLLWTFDKAGLGFSSMAIVGDRLYTMGTRDDQSCVLCVDVAKGSEVWATKIGPIFTFQGNRWGDGPRSTPTVDGDHVYALTGYGELVCLKAGDGSPVWKVHFEKDLGGKMMSVWGYSESVLIDGDRLICTPGGEKGTLAALDKKTGKVLWRSAGLTGEATYASVVPAEIGGVKQYVTLAYTSPDGGSVAGVAAEDGKLLWSHLYSKGATDYLSATPIVKGEQVYVNGGDPSNYCYLLSVSKDGDSFEVNDEYKRTTQKVMKVNQGGAVSVEGHVFGYTDRSGWVCQDWSTGKEVWAEEKMEADASGSLIAADGHLYLYSDLGEAALIKASADGWQESGRFTTPKKSEAQKDRPVPQTGSRVWSHPALANGRLYLRDQEYIFCFDVRGKE